MRKHKHYTCCWQLKSSLTSCRQLQTRSTHTLNQSTNVFILFPHDDAHQMTFINDGKSENEPHKTTSATPERANERTNKRPPQQFSTLSRSLSLSICLPPSSLQRHASSSFPAPRDCPYTSACQPSNPSGSSFSQQWVSFSWLPKWI